MPPTSTRERNFMGNAAPPQRRRSASPSPERPARYPVSRKDVSTSRPPSHDNKLGRQSKGGYQHVFPRSRGRNRCFNCDSRGHTFRNCPKPWTGQNIRELCEAKSRYRRPVTTFQPDSPPVDYTDSLQLEPQAGAPTMLNSFPNPQSLSDSLDVNTDDIDQSLSLSVQSQFVPSPAVRERHDTITQVGSIYPRSEPAGISPGFLTAAEASPRLEPTYITAGGFEMEDIPSNVGYADGKGVLVLDGVLGRED